MSLLYNKTKVRGKKLFKKLPSINKFSELVLNSKIVDTDGDFGTIVEKNDKGIIIEWEFKGAACHVEEIYEIDNKDMEYYYFFSIVRNQKLDEFRSYTALIECRMNSGYDLSSIKFAKLKIANTKTARKLYQNRIVSENKEYLEIEVE